MKKMLLSAVCLAFLGCPAYCMSVKQKADDAMARGYKAALEKDTGDAKEWFRKGMQYSQDAGAWQGLIDSGYGLSTLGLPEEAKSAFDSAVKIVENVQDWHGACALGYAYASLPHRLNTTESAKNMWAKTDKWAGQDKDWTGLIEAGRGFLSIKDKKTAEECLDKARQVVEEAPTRKGINALVSAYRMIQNEKKALECAGIQPLAELPPAGWKPTAGETVRGTKHVPVKIQKAQRESTDKDIERKFQWGQEQARLKQEEKLEKQELAYRAYRDYLAYYSYPYYGSYSGIITSYDDYYSYAWTTQPVWAPKTYNEIYNWALWHMGGYTYTNNVYIAVDID